MATLKAIADGTTYTLTGGAITYRMIMQNTGMAPVRTLTQRGPLQDGVTATGYRLDPRTIRITFMFQATSLSGADDRRSTIYNIFRPRAELMTLEETLDNGNVRRIDGRVTGAMDMPVTPLQDRIGVSQIFTVDFFCPDPTWYDPTVDSTTFDATDNTPWQEGFGTIATANVTEYDEDKAAYTALSGSDIADGNPWSAIIQETTPASVGTGGTGFGLFFFKSPVADSYVRNTYDTTLPVNYNIIRMAGVDNIGFYNYIASGSNLYYIICDGVTVYLYRNNVLFASTAYTYGVDVSESRWGGGISNTWGSALTKVAAYDIALDSTQRQALYDQIVGGNYYASKTINNGGTYAALPIVYLVGPIEDPVLTNTTTGEVLDFTGITIASGDTYIIDCRYGYKTVKNAAGTNKIADLTATSDLATFHLKPGDNAFTLAGTSVNANTQVTINFYPRYVGL